MKTICPYCEAKRDVETVNTNETVEIKGERYDIPVTYYKCMTCKGEFDEPAGPDPLEKAYSEYRSRHGMLQPEDIREFRKRHGLTQNELGKLLGWGVVTLSRYENGALQDEAHDKQIRLAMNPRNLIELIRETPGALDDKKRASLIDDLRKEEEDIFSFERIFEERFGQYSADRLSGYKQLDMSKLFNAILFFCTDGEYKTKLNKLLFYADFSNFREYTVSITGTRYVRLPYGPVPDNYERYYAELIGKNYLRIEEVDCGTDYLTEKLVTVSKPDLLSVFSDSEIKTLADIKHFFRDYTATQIKDFSHKEKGYRETNENQIISYEYADALQVA